MYVKTLNSIFLIYLIFVIFRALTAGLGLFFFWTVKSISSCAWSFLQPSSKDTTDWIIHKDA